MKTAWDRPSGDPRAVIVLGHGAGGDMNDAVLRGVASGLCERGVAALRFNFPYRDAGRKAPGSQKQSEDAYREVADDARIGSVPLFCGGKSYGGRIASHIASEGFAMDGLVFLSYPLHPPGKPERLRDEHLHDVGCPMLFVQGTKDPFATPSLLGGVVAKLDRATLHAIDGGDHSLNVRGVGRTDVVHEVTDAVASFIEATIR